MKNDILNWLQFVFAAIGGWLGWAFGGWDGFMYALTVFIVVDYITGVMCAIMDRELSSEIGYRGIFKKMLIFAFVAIGNIIDSSIIGEGSVIRTAVVFFYISNEGVSILENAAHIGLPVPQKLRDILKQLQDKTEDKE